jgi:hypothetical protein
MVIAHLDCWKISSHACRAASIRNAKHGNGVSGELVAERITQAIHIYTAKAGRRCSSPMGRSSGGTEVSGSAGCGVGSVSRLPAPEA